MFNIIKDNDSVHAVKNVFSISESHFEAKILQWLAVIMWVNLIKMLTVNFPSLSWYKWYFVIKIVLPK